MANRPKIAGRNRINQLSRSSRVDNTFLRASDLDDLMSYLDENIRPYKVYSALLTQSSTNAPTATVLENTLGELVWEYSSEGIYSATLTGAFIDSKTYFSITYNNNDGVGGSGSFLIYEIRKQSSDIIVVSTIDVDLALQTANVGNGLLTNTPIEIRVYN